MRQYIVAVGIAVALFAAREAAAQTPLPGQANPPAAGPDGVTLTRMIVQPEVRASRLEMAVGAERAVHAHTDAIFHLWIPADGTLEITIGKDKPIVAKQGQAFFMKYNTPHGFKNVGTTTAVVFEIFIQEAARKADLKDLLAAFGVDMAALDDTAQPEPLP